MTLKSNSSQLELFQEERDEGAPKLKLSPSFLSYIRVYEKTIFLIVGFLITAIVFFCLGLEKGKNSTVSLENRYLDTSQKSAPQLRMRPASTQQGSAPLAVPGAVKPKDIPKEDTDGFTVQVASFQGKQFAQREAEALRKKGFTVLIISKGDFTVVCVGSFATRDAARSLLSELRQRYRDCYIRRL